MEKLNLTDAEWLLVSDLFERPEGQRGSPVRYERRHLVDACCYLLRTGCAWRLLPSNFAPWQAVYKASCGGSMPAPSSACRTVCADNGAFAWDAAPSPVPR